MVVNFTGDVHIVNPWSIKKAGVNKVNHNVCNIFVGAAAYFRVRPKHYRLRFNAVVIALIISSNGVDINPSTSHEGRR